MPTSPTQRLVPSATMPSALSVACAETTLATEMAHGTHTAEAAEAFASALALVRSLAQTTEEPHTLTLEHAAHEVRVQCRPNGTVWVWRAFPRILDQTVFHAVGWAAAGLLSSVFLLTALVAPEALGHPTLLRWLEVVGLIEIGVWWPHIPKPATLARLRRALGTSSVEAVARWLDAVDAHWRTLEDDLHAVGTAASQLTRTLDNWCRRATHPHSAH